MSSVRIDRCYCFQVTFAEMKEIAARHDAETVGQLQKHLDFGRQCELCHPYVRRMLETGETVFTEVITTGG